MLEVKMGLEFTFQRWLGSGARVSYHSPGIAVRGDASALGKGACSHGILHSSITGGGPSLTGRLLRRRSPARRTRTTQLLPGFPAARVALAREFRNERV